MSVDDTTPPPVVLVVVVVVVVVTVSDFKSFPVIYMQLGILASYCLLRQILIGVTH